MNAALFDIESISTNCEHFFAELQTRLANGGRLLTFYARSSAEPNEVVLTAVFEAVGHIEVLRTSLLRSSGVPSLTRQLPLFHVFEREIYEQVGLEPHDHPWLKPVRSLGDHGAQSREVPFYRVLGKEVHEVAVGPIHAGVIEPGHFRFMCLGETVHHLELELGFAHRGVEALLLSRPVWSLTTLAETIAGDTSVAHAWAYCEALEQLAHVEPTFGVQISRGIALELERVSMHLAGLSGLATDLGFLQGAATYGRLRTAAINTTMLLCGSRFGRGWLRPGGSRASMTPETARSVRTNLALIGRDVAIINAHFLRARGVALRLRGVGTLTKEQAQQLGVVGKVARASGIAIDRRSRDTLEPPYGVLRPQVVVGSAGDCWARALLRIQEIDASLKWLDLALHACATMTPIACEPTELTPNALSIGICEGWRGEVVHCIETNSSGALQHYRVQDPSLRNWLGLALSMRGNEISDFPICNKSFDLSYCGHDL
jgi:Ni,Fe-hydrogenase III large subunit